MTLKGFLIILIFLIICGITAFFISKKYPPKLPQLIAITPAKKLDIKLVNMESYRLEDVRYIRDEKYLKVYPEDNIEMIFPLDVIVSIRIVKGGYGK